MHDSDNSLSDLVNEIKLIRASVECVEKKMDERLNAVEVDVKEMKESMGKMNNEILDHEIKDVNKKCGNMGEKMESVKSRLLRMEGEINKQDRLARKNNVRISGLEETDSEDVGEVVAKLFREKFEEG